jgi:hypothetical protein
MSTSQQNLPSFIIIGAMKCATSTLYKQLGFQHEIFLPDIKEPNFFSDDNVYEKELAWYSSLFSDAPNGSIIGEASTHYSKLPDYPNTIKRIKRVLPDVKIIYIMRDPLERLTSHFIHEWTMNKMQLPIDSSVASFNELTNYSFYSKQITPYLDEFGSEAILPVFFERLTENPSQELERICKFIGCQKPSNWISEESVVNRSSERIRTIPGQNLLLDSKFATFIRRHFIPQFLRDKIKSSLRLKQRPELSPKLKTELITSFNQDLRELSVQIGAPISCDSFKADVLALPSNYCFKPR